MRKTRQEKLLDALRETFPQKGQPPKTPEQEAADHAKRRELMAQLMGPVRKVKTQIDDLEL